MKFEINITDLERNIINAVKQEVGDDVYSKVVKYCDTNIKKEFETFNLVEYIKEEVKKQTSNILLNTKVNDLNITEYIVKNALESIFAQSDKIKTDLAKDITDFVRSNKYSLVDLETTSIKNNLLVRIETTKDKYDTEEHISISVNGETLNFGNGEPEDMTLQRGLNDAFKIEDIIKMAYQYGKQGKDLYFSYDENIDT